MSKSKNMWFIRGVSGAGKSTVAGLLATFMPNASHSEADQYRYVDGVYVWTQDGNKKAHSGCRDATIAALECGMENVIVSNTSVLSRHVNEYKKLAEKYRYRFISLIVENRHETGNVHGVAEPTLCDMERKLRSNIKLK